MHEISNIYIHIPFCDGKCDYCAFYSTIFSKHIADSYLDALSMEIDLYLKAGIKLKPHTIYIGGGTPSVLSIQQIKRLQEIIKSRMDLSAITEWTIEANPGNIKDEFIATIIDSEINRISIGAQIFDNDILHKIGRRHTTTDILKAIEIIKQHNIYNYNIDLISSLPEVTEKIWQDSLYKTIELTPAHISIYNFSIEPGTIMAQKKKSKKLTEQDEDYQLKMLKIAESIMETNGYNRYEISNFAKSGYHSQHNQAYWLGNDYIGFGPAASSRVGLKRWHNIEDIKRYIEKIKQHKYPITEHETLTPENDITERLMFTFRLKDGINIVDFFEKYNLPETRQKKILSIMADLTNDGLIAKNETNFHPTTKGMNFADYIARELAIIEL